MSLKKSDLLNCSNSSFSEVNDTKTNSDQYSSDHNSSETDFESHVIEGHSFKFETDISKETIFEVHKILSGKKVRKKVKSGWSPLLNQKIWEQFKSDCSWSFKRADVVCDEVTVEGKCSFKSCNATIRAQTSNNLSTLKIYIDNFDGNVMHKGNKRRVAGTQKNEIDNMLKTENAFKVQNKIVQKTMKPGDVEPAHLPTLNALRVRKCKERLKNRNKDPYQSLSSMLEYQFRKSIHYIGFNPFYVIYSTPLQRKWYKSQTNKNRSILSIDATGLKIIPPEGSRISDKKTAKAIDQLKYKTVFLYVIVLNGIVPVPVGQMVSQDHTMSFLTFWLISWAFEKKIPDEIHLDQSAALFGACVKAFTNYKSTNAYISGCMDSLLHDTPPPPIYLRIDRYHFVCIIHRIKQFKKMDPLKVGLFKAIFGVLILIHDVSAVKKIICDLFIIMRSRYITKTCEKSLLDLQALCEKHQIKIEEEEYDEIDDSFMEECIIELTEHDSYKETSSYRL